MIEASIFEGTKQQLLFDQTPLVTLAAGEHPPEPLLSKGYLTIPNVKNAQDATAILYNLCGKLTTDPLHNPLLSGMHLAKLNRLPHCKHNTDTSFQALHFDMGQPFTGANQPVYNIIALFCPPQSVRASAQTRILNLAKLSTQKKFGTRHQVEQKILAYVNQHGDGWKTPTPHNTGRLTCFARLIDALAETNKLTHHFNTRMDEWFHAQDPQHSLTQEQAFFTHCGLDISACEELIKLHPGELLIIDNLRTAHGRIGKREQGELYQFMFGAKEAPAQAIDNFRQEIINQFSTR